MRYRGYDIEFTPCNDIARYSYKTKEYENCPGYLCDIYDMNDICKINRLYDVSLVLGCELPSLDKDTVENYMRWFVDANYDRIQSVKYEVDNDRANELLGRLITFMREEMGDADIYQYLTKTVGMDDFELQKCGATFLSRFFDREGYAEIIANDIILTAAENSLSGNWHYDFNRIKDKFGIDLTEDLELKYEITKALISRSEEVSDLVVSDTEFDLMLYTNYCPNYEDDQTMEQQF